MEEIERFIMVVERESVTKAARKLKITQPALSQAIERLEKNLQRKLFKRVGKRLVLTEDGENFYQIAINILKLWNRTKNRNLLTTIKTPLYSIGLYDNAALKLSKFFQKNLTHNNFQFEITINDSENIIKGLSNGIFDLCICVLPKNTSLPSNAILVRQFSEKLLPVSKKVKSETNIQPPFILYNKGSITRSYIDEIFFKKGIIPKILVESTSPAFMKELAIGGCGITLLPKNFVRREIETGKLEIKKLSCVFKRKIVVIINKQGNLNKESRLVKEIIENL